MIAHDRPGVNTTGENVVQLQNACLDPRLSMLEAFAEVFIQAAQPRTAHAAAHALKCARLGWIDKLTARLGHGRSVSELA